MLRLSRESENEIARFRGLNPQNLAISKPHGRRKSILNQPPSPCSRTTDYLARTGAELILRPSEFTANAEDLAQLKESVAAQAPRYRTIEAPTVILTGDLDEVVSPEIHAKAIAAVLPRAKLVVLPGIGHMVQFAAPERIIEAIAEIDKVDALRVPGGGRSMRHIAPAPERR